jgi:hypothetical protein
MIEATTAFPVWDWHKRKRLPRFSLRSESNNVPRMRWSFSSLSLSIRRKSRDHEPLDKSPFSHLQPISQQVFSMAELLENIMGFVPARSSLASCARVSRMWFNPAISWLWSDLETIDPLLALLGTIRYNKTTREGETWVSRCINRHLGI